MYLNWKPLISRCIHAVIYTCTITGNPLVSCSIDSSSKLQVQVHNGADQIQVQATIDAQYSTFSASKVSISFNIQITSSYTVTTDQQDIFLPPLLPTYYIFINNSVNQVDFYPWIAPISTNFLGTIQYYSLDYFPFPYSSTITVTNSSDNIKFKSCSLADDNYNLTVRIRGVMQLATLNNYVEFNAIFINPCHPPHSRLELKPGQSEIPSITSYTVNQTPIVSVTQGTYKLSHFHNNICSHEVNYILTDRNFQPINQNLFTLTSSNRILQVQTSNNSLVGTYNFTMQIYSPSYPSHIIYREFQILILPEPFTQNSNSITIPKFQIKINSTLNTTSAIDLSSFQAVTPSDSMGNYNSSLKFTCTQNPIGVSNSQACSSQIYKFNDTQRRLYITASDQQLPPGTKHSFRIYAQLVSPVNSSVLSIDNVGVSVEVQFQSQNIQNKYLVPKVLTTQSYDIIDGRPKEIDVSNWETSHFEPIKMSMNCNQTINIVDLDSNRQIILVQTENPKAVGRYQIILTGYIEEYQSTVKIMLYVQNSCATTSITKFTPTNMFYDLSWVGEPIEQSFNQWFPSIPQCGVFKYQLVSSQQIPYYIKFNAQNRIIKVEPPITLKEPATFNLAILGTLPQTSVLEHFKVYLTFRCQYASIYSAPFNDYVYNLGSGIQYIQFQQWNTSLNECGQITFKINSMADGGIPSGSLLAVDQENMRIKINSSESSLNGREFSIEVKGSLKMNSKSSLQFFTLTFLRLNEKQKGRNHIISSNCSQQIFPTIKSIDMNGRITIEFPQHMSLYDYIESLSNATIFKFKIVQYEQNLTNPVKRCQFESFINQELIFKVTFRDPQIISTSKVSIISLTLFRSMINCL